MSRIYSEPFAQVPEWLLDADVSDRAVRLFAILHRHAGTKERAFPGRPKLAERLRCSLDSLDRAMADLVKVAAVIVESHYRADGSRGTNSYYLWPHPGPTGAAPQPHPCGGVAEPVPPPSRTGAAPYREREPEERNTEERKPEELPLAEPSSCETSTSAENKLQPLSASADVRAVFDAWLASTKRTNRTVLDDRRKRLIVKALRLYPLADVLDAVRGWEHSAHHRGRNDTGTVYNDLDLLLRNAANIERFRDLARGPCQPDPPPPKVNGNGASHQRPIITDRSGPARRLYA